MTRITYNLNRIPSLILLAVSIAALLITAPRLHAAEVGYSAPHRSLTIACDNRYISQRQASWLLGTDNFSQTYGRRATIHAEIARACATGMSVVRIEGIRASAPVARLSQR